MKQPLIHITRRQALFFAVFLVLYEFLTYIANDMIMPGMIKVVESFHGQESDIGFSLTLYLLGGASLQLILGPLSDRFGRRPVMLTGVVLFLICTIGIAVSNSMEQFLVGRFFQGMGLCFISVIGYATLQEIFSEMEAVRLISVMANVSTIAPLIGPLLGALIVSRYSWRLIFVIIGFFTIISLLGLKKFMPEPVGALKKDGQRITQASISLKEIAKNYSGLLKNTFFILGSFAQGLMSVPCLVWIALAPVILIKEAHLSFIGYGLWQIPVFGACILGNVFLHAMTHFRTVNQLASMGSWVVFSGLLLMSLLSLIFGNYYVWMMPGMILYFFGIGICYGPLMRLTLFSTIIVKGTAAALMCMISMCIQAFGLELSNGLYSNHSNIRLSLYCSLVGILFFGLVRIILPILQAIPSQQTPDSFP